jgi:hypothetical protein
MNHRARRSLMAACAAVLPLALPAVPAAAQTREPPPTVAPPEEPARGSVIRRRGNEGAEAGIQVSRQLPLGQVQQGELDRSDPREEDDSLYEDWTFRGTPGTRVTVSMNSNDFDTYLVWGRMIDGEFVPLASDDDGGEGVGSRLGVWVRDDQEYVVRANAFDRDANGRYSLSVQQAASAADAGTPRGSIRPGQTVQGTLGAGDPLLAHGTFHETWRFTGRPGQRVTVSLRSSEFDTLLLWARVVGAEPLPIISDDDGGPGSSSELTVEVDATGEYAIIVTSICFGGLGAYTLAVEPAGG